MAFILTLELTSSAHTSLVGNMALIAYTVGEAIITLSAYLTLDRQKLKWVNAIFIGSILPYLYFMPETPLYLYSKRQYTKLEAVLRRIATRNKRTEIQWYPSYQEFLRNQSIQEVSNEMKTSFFKQVRQLLSHRPTVIKVLITDLLGFTIYLLYYEIGYGFEVMNISLYLGVFIGAVVEAVGYIWFFSHRYCSGPPGPAQLGPTLLISILLLKNIHAMDLNNYFRSVPEHVKNLAPW